MANMLRPQVSRALQDVKPLVLTSYTEIEAKNKLITEGISPYQPIGILLDNKEKILLPQKINTTDVYVLWDDTGSEVQFHKVGSIKNGMLMADRSTIGRYPQGSPLFVLTMWDSTPQEIDPKPKTGGKL